MNRIQRQRASESGIVTISRSSRSLLPSIFPSLVRPSDVNRTRCSIFILRSQRHSRRVAQNGLSERQPGDSRRRTKSGPDFCWICSRYLLLLFSSYFLSGSRVRGRSIDCLLFAISRLEPAARVRLESDGGGGDDYKVARGGRPKTKTGYLRISCGIYLISRKRPSTIFCHCRAAPCLPAFSIGSCGLKIKREASNFLTSTPRRRLLCLTTICYDFAAASS